MSISKKKLKEINGISVMDEVLRTHVEPSYLSGGRKHHFMDDPPDQWNKSDHQFFDIAVEVEMRVKREIMAILDPSTIEVEEPDEDE